MASMRSLASSLARLSVARPAAPAFARYASTAAAIAPPNYLSSLRSRPGHRLKAKRSGRGWGSSRPRGGRVDGGQKARTKVQIWMAGGGSHPLLKQVPKRPVIHTSVRRRAVARLMVSQRGESAADLVNRQAALLHSLRPHRPLEDDHDEGAARLGLRDQARAQWRQARRFRASVLAASR